jgi:hypothetical protein
MKRTPDSWYRQYKAKAPTSRINPDKFKRVVILLGASDYPTSEIGRMTGTDKTTVRQINSVLGLREKSEIEKISRRMVVIAKTTPEAELKRREAEISRVLGRHDPKGKVATYLTRVKKSPPEVVAERVARMTATGVPFVGLLNKLGASNAKFDSIVERYERGGLTERQLSVQKYLQEKRVSEKVAKAIAGTRIEIAELEPKFRFFESFKLDPAIYGVERIPLAMYEGMLSRQFAFIRKGIKKQILWKLEDIQAEKELDNILVGWRKSKELTTKEPGRIMRPSNLLRRARALIANGKKVTVVALTTYSAETISKGTGRKVFSFEQSKRRISIQIRRTLPSEKRDGGLPRKEAGKLRPGLSPLAKLRTHMPALFSGLDDPMGPHESMERIYRKGGTKDQMIDMGYRRKGSITVEGIERIAEDIERHYQHTPQGQEPRKKIGSTRPF